MCPEPLESAPSWALNRQPLCCSWPFPFPGHGAESQDRESVGAPRALLFSWQVLEPHRPQPRQARWAQSWSQGSEDGQASAGSWGQNHSAPMSPGLSPAVHLCLPIGGPGGEPSWALRAMCARVNACAMCVSSPEHGRWLASPLNLYLLCHRVGMNVPHGNPPCSREIRCQSQLQHTQETLASANKVWDSSI